MTGCLCYSLLIAGQTTEYSALVSSAEQTYHLAPPRTPQYFRYHYYDSTTLVSCTQHWSMTHSPFEEVSDCSNCVMVPIHLQSRHSHSHVRIICICWRRLEFDMQFICALCHSSQQLGGLLQLALTQQTLRQHSTHTASATQTLRQHTNTASAQHTETVSSTWHTNTV